MMRGCDYFNKGAFQFGFHLKILIPSVPFSNFSKRKIGEGDAFFSVGIQSSKAAKVTPSPQFGFANCGEGDGG